MTIKEQVLAQLFSTCFAGKVYCILLSTIILKYFTSALSVQYKDMRKINILVGLYWHRNNSYW